MPPGDQAMFRIRVDRKGVARLLSGEAELRALCEDDATQNRLLQAIAGAVRQRGQEGERLDLGLEDDEARPIFLSVAVVAREGDALLVDGRAVRPRRPTEPDPARLREIEAFAALWAHIETHGNDPAATASVLEQLEALSEVDMARLHESVADGAQTEPLPRAAEVALREQRRVVEAVIGPSFRPQTPLQMRLWLPAIVGGRVAALLEIVLEPGRVPDSWLMELYEGYADLIALAIALRREGSPPPPARSDGGPPPPAELTPRQREIVYLLATGVASTGAIAAQLGVAAPTVKAHLRLMMHRLGVGSRLELVRLAYERWGEWLEAEKQSREDSR